MLELILIGAIGIGAVVFVVFHLRKQMRSDNHCAGCGFSGRCEQRECLIKAEISGDDKG